MRRKCWETTVLVEKRCALTDRQTYNCILYCMQHIFACQCEIGVLDVDSGSSSQTWFSTSPPHKRCQLQSCDYGKTSGGELPVRTIWYSCSLLALISNTVTLRCNNAAVAADRICLRLHGKVSSSLPNRQKTYNIELFWRVILGQRSLRNLRMPVTCFITAETVQDRTSWRKIQYNQDGLVIFVLTLTDRSGRSIGV